MRSALRKAAKVGIADVAACGSASSLAAWAAEQLGQIAILSIALHWTSQTEAALRGAARGSADPQTHMHGGSAEASGTTGEHGSTGAGGALWRSRSGGAGVTLAGLLEEHEALVAALAAVLGARGPAAAGVPPVGVAALRRQVLEALLLTVLHLRDVLRRLLAARAAGVDDFAWQAQLRFASPPSCLPLASFAAGVVWSGTAVRHDRALSAERWPVFDVHSLLHVSVGQSGPT